VETAEYKLTKRKQENPNAGSTNSCFKKGHWLRSSASHGHAGQSRVVTGGRLENEKVEGRGGDRKNKGERLEEKKEKYETPKSGWFITPVERNRSEEGYENEGGEIYGGGILAGGECGGHETTLTKKRTKTGSKKVAPEKTGESRMHRGGGVLRIEGSPEKDKEVGGSWITIGAGGFSKGSKGNIPEIWSAKYLGRSCKARRPTSTTKGVIQDKAKSHGPPWGGGGMS